jgi:hypothetical protein
VAIAPIFLWDGVPNRSEHPAYLILLAVNIPFALAVRCLWDTPGSQQTARQFFGVR